MDDLNHGKVSVWVFMHSVIKELKSEMPQLSKLKIFSDGCAAQFKNKFTLSNLLFFEEDFSVKAEWNFFASYHGKGAVDGVGGRVKHSVWLAVKSRKRLINTAEDFYNCAREVTPGIKVLFITALEVKSAENKLQARWESVNYIPNLQSLHHFTVAGKSGALMVSQTSSSANKEVVNVMPSEKFLNSAQVKKTNLKYGDFVLVHLEGTSKGNNGRDYYALVLEVEEELIHLRYMHPIGLYN